MKKKEIIIGILFLLIIVLGCFIWTVLNPRMCGRGSGNLQVILEDSGFLPDFRMKYQCWGSMEQVTGIILHYTATNTAEHAIEVMEKRDLFVQLIVDEDGSVYQLTDYIDDFSAGATGGNAWGINIEIVGNHVSLMRSAATKDDQFMSVVRTIRLLADEFDIPVTNELPPQETIIWSGIFSHEQVDKYHPKGGRRNKIDPGREYMKAVMSELGEEIL